MAQASHSARSERIRRKWQCQTRASPDSPAVSAAEVRSTRRWVMRHVNLAGRAGRWSAAHWKSAAFGWIAFAVAAVFVGSAVGVTQMKSWAITNGDSRRAEQILAQADFKTPARESVLVQSQRVSATDPSFVAVV